VTRLQPVWETIRRETEKLIEDSGVNLLATFDSLEDALDRESIFDRVMTAMNSSREKNRVEILDYRPVYDRWFKELNEEWLREYFRVEPEDDRILGDPGGTIIRKGGDIFFASWRGRIVGTAALLPAGDGDLELAKMGVSAETRGRGIGRILAEEAIRRARARGVPALELLTSPLLDAACALYRSLGFVTVEKTGEEAIRYERETIRMRLPLTGEPDIDPPPEPEP